MENLSYTHNKKARVNVIALFLLTLLIISSYGVFTVPLGQLVVKIDPNLSTSANSSHPPTTSSAFSASGVVAYVPITLSDMESASTPVGFQVQLNVDMALYSSYLNGVAENIEFYDSAWKPLSAWIQTNAFNASSTSTLIWVKLDQPIPAYNAITIYLGFLSTSVDNYNASGYVGTSPEQTGIYGYFDNGPSVFNFYFNFIGKTLNSNTWANVTYNGGQITMGNGLVISGSASSGWAYGQIYTKTAASNQVVDAFINSSTSIASGSEWDIGFETTVPQSGSGDLSFGTAYRYDWWGNTLRIITDVGGTAKNSISENAPSTTGYQTGMWPTTGSEKMLQAYGNALTGTDSEITFGNSYVFLYFANNNPSSYQADFQYVLTRDYPPSGVMPSANWGAAVQVSSVPSYLVTSVPIEISNTQGQTINGGFQQLLNINMSNYKSYLSTYPENIEFYDSSWNNLSAWIESGAWNDSGIMSVWVKTSSSIPASNSITIYLGFLPTSYSEYGTWVGLAPQLTGTYGYFDTGQNVFNFYDNFQGTRLSSQWAVSQSRHYTVNNGITITPAGANLHPVIYSRSTFSSNVIDIYANIPSGGTGSDGAMPILDWALQQTTVKMLPT